MGENNRSQRKICRYCSKHGIRKDAIFLVSRVRVSPGLCLEPRFKEFHANELEFFVVLSKLLFFYFYLGYVSVFSTYITQCKRLKAISSCKLFVSYIYTSLFIHKTYQE